MPGHSSLLYAASLCPLWGHSETKLCLCVQEQEELIHGGSEKATVEDPVQDALHSPELFDRRRSFHCGLPKHTLPVVFSLISVKEL